MRISSVFILYPRARNVALIALYFISNQSSALRLFALLKALFASRLSPRIIGQVARVKGVKKWDACHQVKMFRRLSASQHAKGDKALTLTLQRRQFRCFPDMNWKL